MGRASKPKVEEGREFARAVLVQEENDLQVHDGKAVDVHPQALRNPGVRKLRDQFRHGLGSDNEQLPVSAFTHLMDRWAGKVVDRVKMAITERPYEGESDDELIERLSTLRRQLEKSKKASDE